MGVARIIPRPWRPALKRMVYAGRRRHCPVCDRHARRFVPGGENSRPEAACPFCGSLERHRLVWLYFQRRTNLFDRSPKRVLHVAPESMFQPRLLEALAPGYLTADLFDPSVMERMDITDINHPDAAFDVIYCSHVLEHVPDDRKAMREFRRVLKPGGWAVLLVPITAERTIEDTSITDPAERLRRFGQEDHVRRYGSDFEHRLREAGFAVTRTPPGALCTPLEIERYQLSPTASGDVFHCVK